MAIYTMAETSHELHTRRLRKARLWLTLVLAVLLPISLYLHLNSTGRSSERYELLFAVSLAMLLSFWNPFRKRSVYLEVGQAFRINSIGIEFEGLTINWATWSRFLPWSEVIRVEEPPKGRGMHVRTQRRFLWYVIPRGTDRYEGIKSEFVGRAISVIATSAPANWGFLFVGAFCASLLCNLLTRDRRILAINFAVALIVGAVGTMSGLRIGDRRLRFRSILGSFLPAALSAVSLAFPFELM